MVIDTSALLAGLLREPAADRLLAAIQASSARHVSVATVLEASLVLLARIGDQGDLELDAFLRELAVEVVPATAEQSRIARDAAVQFGKGRHPAGLNYGDLFSYALAASLGEPLLFVGDDFSKTDVTVAGW
ncbi:MAG: type II toxin-antitoxin system VapC family toxin [Gemmatimonadales bacterium]